MKLKILELFSGIRALSKALEKLGIDYECVDSVEIDKYAIKSQNEIYGTNFEPQDITKWDKQLDVDLIMHGSPCQDFSLAGKQAGGDEGSGTRSSLLYETIRIVSNLKPKYVIWENVKNVLSKKHRHNFDNYLQEMESLGYTNYYQVLNAKDYGIPQNRERVFTISILGEHNTFDFPQKQELKLKLKDMLEDKVDEKYYLSEETLNKITINRESENCIQWNRIGGELEMWCRAWRNIAPTVNTKCQETKVLIKEATKKGYKEAYEGDSINLEQPNSQTRRGRVGNQVAQTLTTSCNQATVINPLKGISGKSWQFEQNVYDSDGITRSLKAGGGSGNIPKTIEGLKIRKLTPKECWRLMGFDDEDFEKASQVNSNAQLCKQAGNSICVNVLEAILTNLLK